MPDSQSAEEGLDKLFYEAFREVQQALRDVAQDVAAQGTQHAPVDTGILRASISAETQFKVDRLKGQMSLEVVARTPYAYIQHENEDFNHPRGGEAKYLTKPAAERADQYRATIAAALATALRRSEA